jgi:hypothetical protein
VRISLIQQSTLPPRIINVSYSLETGSRFQQGRRPIPLHVTFGELFPLSQVIVLRSVLFTPKFDGSEDKYQLEKGLKQGHMGQC